jgi:hypothetical protein
VCVKFSVSDNTWLFGQQIICGQMDFPEGECILQCIHLNKHSVLLIPQDICRVFI